jgi:hypothetical protein
MWLEITAGISQVMMMIPSTFRMTARPIRIELAIPSVHPLFKTI